MNASTSLENVLAVIARVLLWCSGLGFLIMLLPFVAILVAGDFVYGIHSQLYDISQHEFTLIFYSAMIWMKTTIFVFFLIPYIAVRLTLRGVGKA